VKVFAQNNEKSLREIFVLHDGQAARLPLNPVAPSGRSGVQSFAPGRVPDGIRTCPYRPPPFDPLSELEFEVTFAVATMASNIAVTQGAVLSLRSLVISMMLLADKGDTVLAKFAAVPPTDGVFDLKTRLLQIFACLDVHHCPFCVMDCSLGLPATLYLSR
jgi:hypothetical protein